MRSRVAWVAERAGVVLAVAGAVALAVSLWLPWFARSPVCIQTLGFPCPRVVRYSGWESFRAGDAALAALACAAVALALAGPAVGARLAPVVGIEAALARSLARLALAAVGWAALCLSLYAVFRPSLPADPSRVPDTGYFVALVGGGGIVGGALWDQWGPGRR